MPNDPFDQYSPSSRYLLDGESEDTSLERIDKRIAAIVQEGKQPRSGHLSRIVLLLAAAAVALVLIINHPWSGGQHSQLAESYFSPYPNYALIQIRGDDAGSMALRQDAYAAYDSGDYLEAIRAFSTLEDDATELDRFYQAQALQATGQWEAALSILGRISLAEEYLAALRWHTALSRVATGDIDIARSLLIPLMTERTEFSSDARTLLDAL